MKTKLFHTRKESLVFLIIFFFLVSTFIQSNFNSNTPESEEVEELISEKGLKISKATAIIHVDNNWSAVFDEGICTGEGTYSNPYIIEDEKINGNGAINGILIQNSRVYFWIKNCTIHGSESGITFDNVTNGFVVNNTLYDIYGCNGTDSSYYLTFGGTGGMGSGIKLSDSHNNTLFNNDIVRIKGGKGGKGGSSADGGYGGIGTGIYISNAVNNTLDNNTLNEIIGGLGGVGGTTAGHDGADGTGIGIYLERDSYQNTIKINNTLDDDPIIFLYNNSDHIIKDLHLSRPSNPTNLGKMAFIKCENITVQKCVIENYIGVTNVINHQPGYNGTGIFIFESFNNLFINNTIINITGGRGGRSGFRGSSGNGGLAAGLYLSSASNNTFNNNLIGNITGGIDGVTHGTGYNGTSGLGFGVFMRSDSLDNVIHSNNTINRDPIIYCYNISNFIVSRQVITNSSNPTNLGKMAFLNCQNLTINDNVIAYYKGNTNKTGPTDEHGFSASNGVGIYLFRCINATLANNTITDITGGTGGTGSSFRNGGYGGIGAGIYLDGSSYCYFINNTIHDIVGGQGGDGGHESGSGGPGGLGAGIYLFNANNNTFNNNTIRDVIGGRGGTKAMYGVDGSDQLGFGIFIESDSHQNCIHFNNTFEGEQILYFYNQVNLNISNFLLNLSCNPTNLGKIVLIKCMNITIQNNTIANYQGATGKEGIIGDTGAGISLFSSLNITLTNNTIYQIKGGDGGIDKNGGSGGIGAGIYLYNSSENSLINNKLDDIMGGRGGSGENLGTGGTGGIGASFYFSASINNILNNNTITNITGGLGGSCGHYGASGVNGTGYGVFLESNSYENIIYANNTIDGDPIIYLYNHTNMILSNYDLTFPNNPTNLGKIAIIKCVNITINNNKIENYEGRSNKTGSLGQSGGNGWAGAGIYIYDSNNNTIENNTISNIKGGRGGSGGYQWPSGLTGGAGGKGAGIFLSRAINNTINNNTICNITGGKGGFSGLYTYSGTDSVGYGIYLESDSYQNKIHANNTHDGDPIIYLYNETNKIVRDYNLTSNTNPTNLGKIVLINCFNITIKKNSISNYQGNSNKTGDYNMKGSRGYNGVGIYLFNSFNNTIANNTICNITGGEGGVGGGWANGGIGGMGLGIFLHLSGNNTFEANIIINITGGKGGRQGPHGDYDGAGGLGAGFYLQQSLNNTFFNNTVINIAGGTGHSDNLGYGIHITLVSKGNLICLNNLSNNDKNAWDDGAWNQWDNGTLGNYWDDYEGFDNDGDGRGDIPYEIEGSASSKDNYPIWGNQESTPPKITIQTPVLNALYGRIAPEFVIIVEDPNLNATWYSLDGGLSNYTFEDNGTILQSAWDAKDNGTVIIDFYANDTLGNENSTEIEVRKDIISPTILIKSPSVNSHIGETAPEFSVSINDPNRVNHTWYSLDNGITRYEFESNTTINQTAWNSLSNGKVQIRFYANDSVNNLGYTDVEIWKDTIKPIIMINSPVIESVYGALAPNFNIHINETNLKELWYSLDDGLNLYYFSSNGTINQTAWQALGNGSASIRFYANDYAGNLEISEVIIKKDIIAPIIKINSPVIGEEFTDLSPFFNISVQDPNLNSVWYTINNGDLKNYIVNFSGYVNQSIWSSQPEGEIVITFYAEDNGGNMNSAEIIIIKKTAQFDFSFILIFIILGTVIGMASGGYYTAKIIKRKRTAKEGTEELKKLPSKDKLVSSRKGKKILSKKEKELQIEKEEIASNNEIEPSKKLKTHPKKVNKFKKSIESSETSKVLSESDKKELEKTESEVAIKKKTYMCVVHRGPIEGNIYLCPNCQAFYCFRCAKVLKLKGEKCWSCGNEINVLITEEDKNNFLKEGNGELIDEIIAETPELSDYLENENTFSKYPPLRKTIFSRLSAQDLKRIDLLELSQEDKKRFIKEIMNLKPKERKKLINEMLEDSEESQA